MSQSQPIDQSLLTSYALGELNAAERAQVETYLISHPEARQEVEDLKSLAELLSSELKAESMPGLDPARRAEIEALTSAPRTRRFFARLDARPFAAAAGLVIAIGGAISFGLGGPRVQPVAKEQSALDSQPLRDHRLEDESKSVDKNVAHFRETLGNLNENAKDSPGVHFVKHGKPEDETVHRADCELVESQSVDLFAGAVVPDSAAPRSESAEVSENVVVGLGGGWGGERTGRGGTSSPIGVRAEGRSPAQAPGRPDGIGLAPGGGSTPSGAGSSSGYAPVGTGVPGPGPGPAGGGIGGTMGGKSAPAANGGPGTKEATGSAPLREWSKIRNRGPVELDRSAEGRRKSSGENSLAAPPEEPSEKLAETNKALRNLQQTNLGKVDPEKTEELKREILAMQDKLLELRRRNLEDEVRRAGGEDYSSVIEQPFKVTTTEPLSTIGLDIDTASYANVRRYLQSGQWPPRDAVRVDEMVNYFHYNDPAPKGEENLAIHAEVATCPWNMENRLLRVAFKAKEIAADERGATNLVFLVDVSGSMRNNDKLPLLKEGLKALTRELKEDDSVAIVTYASGVRVALEPTYGNDQAAIINVLDSLSAGGSTNGAGGIQMAYEMAQRHFVDGGTNRVLLCTDGDFNVGVSDTDELTRMITEKAQSGVFLSVLGFGTGNIKDGRMQALANKGNGHYAYIDSDREAQKVLVDELSGTLVTVAKDAKLQIEFSPAEVSSWRLLGYSARILQAQDFNDDKKDAGEIGAGHSVIALYEIEPARKSDDGRPAIDPLKYQKTTVVTPGAPGEIASVRLRYKLPDAEESRLRTLVVMDEGLNYGAASADFKLSASVALFGMLLSKSEFAGQTGLAAALELAEESINSANDQKGWRREFAELIRKAIAIREREYPNPQQR